MKLTCIIVDDEPIALDILEDYIRRTPSLELAGRFTSSADALRMLADKAVEGRPVDIAFLDIQMPGLGGLEMAKLVGKGGAGTTGGDTRVIFTTAFPQYALEGFRLEALDYLLKPVSFAEFTRAVERSAEWFAIKRAAQGRNIGVGEASSQTAGAQNPPQTPQTLIVRSDYKQFVIPISTIVYIEGIRDYIRIHLDGGESLQTLMNMKTVEGMLPATRFARVHRSYIVNLERVKRIERSRIVLDGPDLSETISVPISDTYKEAFSRSLAARSL